MSLCMVKRTYFTINETSTRLVASPSPVTARNRRDIIRRRDKDENRLSFKVWRLENISAFWRVNGDFPFVSPLNKYNQLILEPKSFQHNEQQRLVGERGQSDFRQLGDVIDINRQKQRI